MAHHVNRTFRECRYEQMPEGETGSKGRFETLRSRLAADIGRMPAELRPGAYAVATAALEGVLEALEDAVNMGPVRS